MDKLNQDPEWVAGARRREEEAEQRRKTHAAIERPMVKLLRKAGFEVDSIWDLVYTGQDYRRAIPMLMEWVPQITDPRVKDSLIRVLSVPWAKPQAAPLFISQFREIEDGDPTGVGWTLGNALEVVADDSFCAELVELALDRRYGRAREMIVLALGKMKKARPVDALIELLDDEVVVGHAIVALRKLKAPEAAEALKPFLDHPDTWIRNEARKALGVPRSPRGGAGRSRG
jgi:hypothetical protein